MTFSVRAIVAIGSAVVVWVGAILQALQAFGATSQPGTPLPNQDSDPRTLDFQTLSALYAWKRTQIGFDIFINLLFAAGLLGLAYVTLILKRVFRKFRGGTTDMPKFMVGCFFIGAILPSVQFLQSVGFTTASAGMSDWAVMKDPNNPQPLQALFIATTLVRFSTIYLFSLQFIFIPIGLILASVMTLESEFLPRGHGILGAITGAIGLLVFILEIISYNEAGIAALAILGILVLLWGVILLPIWMVWLGVELRKLKERGHDERTRQVELTSSKLPAAVADTAY